MSDSESDTEDEELLDVEEPELMGPAGAGLGELDSEDDFDDSVAVEISAVPDRRVPTAHGRRTQHMLRKEDSDDDF